MMAAFPSSTHRAVGLAAVAVFVFGGISEGVAQPTDGDGEPVADSEGGGAGEGDLPVLSRTEALERAVENNHDIDLTRQRETIADRNVSPGNAGLLPTARAVISQNHQFGGSGLFGSGQIFTRTTLGVQVEWVMFEGFGRLATRDRLKAVRTEVRREKRAEIDETLQEVATAYWDVVRQQRLLEALRETRDISEKRVDIARSRLDAGVGSKVDVNLARVELNEARSAVAEQKIALTEAKTALNQTLARSADTEFRVGADIQVADDLSYEDLRRRAMGNNHRLAVLRQRRDVATSRIEEAKAERWPTLSASLGYNYTGFHSGVIPNFDTAPALEYGLTLDIPLFRGFNVRRRIRNSRTERSIAGTEIQREKTRIQSDLRDAFEAYRRYREQIVLADESVQLADDNVDIALTELESGAINQVEFRRVQRNLLDARRRLVDAEFKAKRAEIRLRRLSGQLYDELLP